MASSKKRGDQFEEEVRQLLQLKGYSLTKNELINGTQIDLVARKNDLFDNICFVIECTDRSEAVGIELVKQKASVLLSLHDPKYLFRLIFVARHSFTAEAKAFADSQPTVILLTFTDLESQLIDFRRYADWYLSNYETSSGFFSEGQLYANYVELTARNQDGSLALLTPEVRRWLQDRSNNLLFLLGEYGSGKTSFCRHLVYELLAEKFREHGNQRHTPILFNLREYRKSFSIKQLVTDTLVNQYGLELRSFMAFERLCSSGNVLLVLDGFDEMADKSDKRTLADCFRQIYTIASLNAKVIVSCRSNFFQSNADVISLLRQFSIEIPYNEGPDQRITRLSFERQGAILTVEKLNDDQIKEYIDNRFGEEANSIYSEIRKIHDLSDLSTRPVLLDMVLSTLPELSTSRKRINSASLYQHYTDRWTARDEWRVAVPLEVRQQFCETLSWNMHNNSLSHIPYARLEQAMVYALAQFTESDEQLEAFKNDLQTCSFLVREGTGDTFRFAHKSFVEYFVARKLAATLAGGESVTKPLPPPAKPLTSPVFIGETISYSTRFSLFDYFDTTEAFEDFHPKLSRAIDRLTNANAKQLQFNSTFARKLEQEIRSPIEDQRSKEMRAFRVSEEVATFALEMLENLNTPLPKIISTATAAAEPRTPLSNAQLSPASSLTLLSDILRLGKATELVRRNQELLRDYILNGKEAILRISFCAALARLPGSVSAKFLQQTRSKLSPGEWSYFLVELASQPEYHEDVFEQLSQDNNDLRIVDRLICAHAVRNRYPEGEQDRASESLTFELLDSSLPEELELGLVLFPYLCLRSKDGVMLTVRAYKKFNDRKIKREMLNLLCAIDEEKAYSVLLNLSYRESDPFLKDYIFTLRGNMRDVKNHGKMRQSWNYARVHGQVKEKMWKSLQR